MSVSFAHRNMRASSLPASNAVALIPKSQMKEEGTVKWYEAARRIGFIEVPGQSDVFFHKSDLHKYGLRDQDVPKGRKVFFLSEQKPGLRPQVIGIALA